jgi:hypothetical protein
VEKPQGHGKVRVWCRIKSTKVFETLIFGHMVNAVRYAQILKYKSSQIDISGFG